jgi:hypothetical protein
MDFSPIKPLFKPFFLKKGIYTEGSRFGSFTFFKMKINFQSNDYSAKKLRYALMPPVKLTALSKPNFCNSETAFADLAPL